MIGETHSDIGDRGDWDFLYRAEGGAANLEEVAKELESLMRKRYASYVPDRMVGLLFARPGTEMYERLFKSEEEHLHLHLISGDHVDFFCMGFHDASPGKPFPSWRFDMTTYVAAREEVMNRCAWKPSGQVDLLLLTVRRPADKIELDFSTVIAFDIARMLSDEVIDHPLRLFEAIIADARNNPLDGGTKALGHRKMFAVIRKALGSYAMDRLDKIASFARAAWKEGKHFAVLSAAS